MSIMNKYKYDLYNIFKNERSSSSSVEHKITILLLQSYYRSSLNAFE